MVLAVSSAAVAGAPGGADGASLQGKEACAVETKGPLRWATALGDDLVVAPAIATDLVIAVGLAQSSRGRLGFLSAVDRRSGQHRFRLAGAVGTGLEGGVLATPAVAEDLACFAGGGGTVACVDLPSGKVRWATDGYGSTVVSPVIRGGQVFVAGEDGRITALALGTGDKRWSFQTGDAIRAELAIDGDLVFAASWDGHLYALGMEGTLVWRFDTPTARPTAMRIASGVIAFFDAGSGELRAVSFTKRADSWHVQDAWRFDTGQRSRVRPIAASGLVCIAVPIKGLVACLDAATGSPRWTATLPGPLLSPVLAGRHLVVSSRSGDVWIMDLETGGLIRHVATGVSFDSDPGLGDGILFVGGKRTLYAVALE
jgi:outer membrane protein assembly factor BamB